MSSVEPKALLYLCDGKACPNNRKLCCFTNDMECRHTTNVEHAISHLDKNFPKTNFYQEFYSDGDYILVEQIDWSPTIEDSEYAKWL